MRDNICFGKQLWVWSLIVLWLLLPLTGQAQEPTIVPESIFLELAAGQCQSQTVRINTLSALPPKLDLFFVVDVTSSMQSVIDQVAQDLPAIANNIRTVIPDSKIGLATVADYPAAGRSAGIEPWTIIQPLSDNTQLMQQQLDELRLFSSGDPEEAYLRALFETQFLAWRPDSRRIVILLGDAPVHDPDLGRDGILGTADDLTEIQLVSQLQAANITVLAASRRKPEFFTTITQATGGQFVILSNLAKMPEILQLVLTETIKRINVLDFRVSENRSNWVKWEPALAEDVSPGDSRTFALEICVPDDQSAGQVAFPVMGAADGVSLGQVFIDVTVITSTPTPTRPPATLTPTAGATATASPASKPVTPAATNINTGLNTNGEPDSVVSDLNSAPGQPSSIFSGIQGWFVTLFSLSDSSWRVLFFILLPFFGFIWAFIYEQVIDR